MNYVHSTPRKTRLVADAIRGLNVNEAQAKLMLSPRKAGLILAKLLRSAVANAENNFKIETAKLFIKEIRVDQGTKTKRWLPRARGSASPLERRTSHGTLVLGVSDKLKAPRFTMPEKPKKKKLSHKDKMAMKEKETAEKKPEIPKERQAAENIKKSGRSGPGFFRKVFQRKSI